MGIRIAGLGAYVPDQRVTNDDLARRIDTSHAWISARTGILERRVASPTECPSDMACQAALRCLSHRRASRPDVGSSLRRRGSRRLCRA